MLTSGFDAGGDEESPALTVAGFVSSEREGFTERSCERFNKDGIQFLRPALQEVLFYDHHK